LTTLPNALPEPEGLSGPSLSIALFAFAASMSNIFERNHDYYQEKERLI